MKISALPGDRRRGPRHPLHIVYEPTAALRPDPANARRHSPRQIAQIARSMATFGPIVPILVDATGRIVAGHGRWLAAQELGLAQVPTIPVTHLSEAERRAFMLADNRLTENSEWDPALLRTQLRELASIDVDFSLEVTGFDLPEIDLIVSDVLEGGGSDRDDAPLLPAPAVSRVGDIWLLGDHRLACGSALDATVYAALMGEDRAALVFTDPPYNVPIKGHVSGLGKHQHREFIQASGEMNRAEFADFLRASYRLMAAYSESGSLVYVCCDWRHVCDFHDAADGLFTARNLVVWNKGAGAMGSLYRSQHELIWVFKFGGDAHTNNVQLGRFGRSRTNVWDYPGANAFARKGDERDLLALHPTVKPVAMVADALMDASHRGEIVLDPFAGSGTTVIAAERAGRRARAVELDPLYADVAVRRWERMTGRSARHATLPCTFAELEETRSVRHG